MNELTEDILKGAEANKSQQKKKRTTAQLPIYRDASNLLYIIMRVMYHAPRKMTKALDEAIVCGTELCRSLALANEVRGMERAAALNITPISGSSYKETNTGNEPKYSKCYLMHGISISI